jgi:hypothetical protein
MKLADLQRLFQESVLAEAPAERLLSLLRQPARADHVAGAFAVYHDGFRLRMAEFLANDYPALSACLGELAFDAMVEAFWRARPSKFRNARWVGAGLPEFLRTTAPWSHDTFVCGLAALEAGVAQSFDAEDAPSLPIEILGATHEEDWPRLRFSFHPGLVMVETTAPALAAYEATQSDEPAPEPEAGPALTLAVWRQEFEVQYRALDEMEALALPEALAGARFGEICAMLAFARPDETQEWMAATAGGFPARWFADGVIVAASPAPD